MKFPFFFFVLLNLIPLGLARFYQFIREETFIVGILWSLLFCLPIFYTSFKKTWFIVLGIMSCLICLTEVGHILLFQGRISSNSFAIILDSNINESKEFLRDQLELKTILIMSGLFLFCSSAMVYVYRKLQFTPSVSFKKYFALAIVLPFIVFFGTKKFDLAQTMHSYVEANGLTKYVIARVKYDREIQKMMELKTQFDQKGLTVLKAGTEDGPATHILILGESTTRKKMSLYGYFRSTNPLLESKRNDLVVMQNAYCSKPPGTMRNLKKILTFLNSENENTHPLDTNLINLMKDVGYKTYWISNQVTTGENNNMTTAIARCADQVKFLNATDATSYDEKIFPAFKRALNDPTPKKFIIVHLLGTHMKYRERFPDEFDVFKETKDIPSAAFMNDKKRQYYNDYDNAVRYNDYIVSKIIDETKKGKDSKSVFFLSDHGEEVYGQKDFHGHPGTFTTVDMLEIPLIAWFAPELADKKKILEAEKETPVVSDDLIHTLVDVYGLSHPYYVATKSLLSQKFLVKDVPKTGKGN